MRRHTLNKYPSRLMACLLVFLLVFSWAPAARATEVTEPAAQVEPSIAGTCGDSLSWSLSAGTLTITGSGAMTDYTEQNMAPWYPVRDEIIRLELPDGLTSIGTLAFYRCKNLTTVVLPDSVTRVGDFAFAHCTGMELLNLGNGLTHVGESAFSDCYSLTSLRLPETLRSIGLKGFYRCESITAVTIPSSVTQIGLAAFGYCKDLVTANVRASVTSIPELMFYGCEKLITVTISSGVGQIGDYAFRGCDTLATVHYGGGTVSAEDIQEMINDDIPGFDVSGLVTDSSDNSTVTSGSTTENEDGSFTQENVTVSQGDNSSVSTRQETEYSEDATDTSHSVSIDVTVEGEEGWKEAQEAVEDALSNYNDAVSAGSGEANTPDINIYVTDTDTIDQDFLDALAGRDVNLTITTQDGSIWRIHGTDLDAQFGSGQYNLSYTLTSGSPELCQELETDTSYVLKFHAPAEVNAEVLITLSASLSHQNATLLQRNDSELTRVQTVVVDNQGRAHFYLASVREDTDYYIAMNLPSHNDEIIPAELTHNYGQPINYNPIQYEITGRTSSWGMTINQVTWIMIGGLTACVVVVGFVMYTLNKRKLAMGYVPELDEEDYE